MNADSATHWVQQIREERPQESAVTARQPSTHRAGEFELLTRMGQGGMGIVYRAWQSSLHRQVAVKTLQRSADSKAAARFAREIHALARVEHPNVVKIFSSGIEHDQLYFAMELIDGADMGAVNERLQEAKISADRLGYEVWYEYLKRSIHEARLHEVPLDDQFQLPKMLERESAGQPAATARGPRAYVRHIVTLLYQVAQATQFMHDAGIVHRDIKPGNIMLTENGQNAVLMDLGLAQLADDNQQKLTQTRTFVGTLRYASPEQVLSASAVDRRSDIYSLGATLWELLTLRPLFGITDEVSSLELMQRIQHTDPQSIRVFNPSVPKDLDAIVSKCLEKSPGQRYQTAGELADDLSRFLNSEPVRVRPLGKMSRAARYVRRHPVGSGFVLACVTTLLTMSILAVNAWNLQKERQFVAQLQEANERADASFRQAVKTLDDVFTLVTEGDLRKRPDLQPLRDQLLTYYQGYVRQFGAGQDLDAQIVVELAAAFRRMAKITKDAGDKEDALTHYSAAIRNYQSLLATTPASSSLIDALSQTLIDRGLLLQELRAYEKAEHDLVQASDALAKLIEQNPQDLLLRRSLADAYHNLGILYEEENRYPQSFSFYERGRQIREQLVTESDDRNFKRDLGRSYGYLGDVQIAMGEYQDAFRSYQRSVELRQDVADSEPSDHEARFQLARGYRNLGHLSQLESDLEEAIEWYLKATDEERRLVAEEPFIADYRADLGRYSNDLAEVLFSRGKLANKPEYNARAETHLLESLAINRELTERNPGDMVAVSALACTYVNLARLALTDDSAKAQEYMDLSRQQFDRLSNYSADDLYQQAVLECLVSQAASLNAASKADASSPPDGRHVDKSLSLLSQAVIKSRYTVLPRLGRDPAFVDLRNRTEFQLLSAIGFQGFENLDQVAVRGDRSLASAASRSAYKHLYVLAVGVSSYKDSKYSLQFPDDDARDLAAVLDQQRHFETVTVKALTDEQADRVSILNALKQLRLKALHPSLLLVALSGHGRLHESGDYYFLPFDFDFDPNASIAATGISWDDLLREFREIPGAVIVVLDTCHSGATTQIGFRGLSSDAMDTSVRQAAEKISGSEGKGVAVLASSLSSQAAQERPGWGHGALSLAILEALCNQHVYQQSQRSRLPALGAQRMLSMEQVRAYAVERVNELTDGQQKVIV
ncbi:MAG: protein kinase domain-containing protein [Planctomycetaceae bacterium]